MLSLRIALCSSLVALALVVDWSSALPAGDKETLINELSMMGPGGAPAADSAEERSALERDFLLNYLAGRRFVKRLRSQVDNDEYQRKRNYWRQCAFNAVSCFGK